MIREVMAKLWRWYGEEKIKEGLCQVQPHPVSYPVSLFKRRYMLCVMQRTASAEVYEIWVMINFTLSSQWKAVTTICQAGATRSCSFSFVFLFAQKAVFARVASLTKSPLPERKRASCRNSTINHYNFLIVNARSSSIECSGDACTEEPQRALHPPLYGSREYIIYGRFIDHLLECDWLMINVLGGPIELTWLRQRSGEAATKSAVGWRRALRLQADDQTMRPVGAASIRTASPY